MESDGVGSECHCFEDSVMQMVFSNATKRMPIILTLKLRVRLSAARTAQCPKLKVESPLRLHDVSDHHCSRFFPV